jgi:hypothetical protein
VAVSGGEGVVGGVDITLAPGGEAAYGITFGLGGGTALAGSETAQYTTSTCWTCGNVQGTTQTPQLTLPLISPLTPSQSDLSQSGNTLLK